MQVRFIEKTHQYLSDKGELTSVSSFVKGFEQKKDWAAIAKKKAANLKKYQGIIKSVDEILAEWERKRNLGSYAGTILHEIKEKETLAKYSNVKHFGFKGEGEYKESFDLSLLEDGYIYPELMCYDFDNMICGQSDEVEIKNKQIIIRDFKGLCLETDIPTINGLKQMKDIQVGDIIYDGEGNPTTVQHVSDIHYNDCFKITFDTNETVICDHEHKWEIDSYNYNKRKFFTETVTTEVLFNKIQNKENIKIKCIDIKSSKKDLPIDPYVLGIWLGDGNSHVNRITCANDKVYKEIEKRGYKLGQDVSRGGSGIASEKTILNIRDKFIQLNLFKNKHIPEIYFNSSFEQRLDLLRGYLDSDGSLNIARKRCQMSTTNYRQAADIQRLVSSLGYKATIMGIPVVGFGLKKRGFSVCFTMKDINPFLNKIENYFDVVNKDNHLGRSKRSEVFSRYRIIKKMERVKTVPTKCISVDSPLSTYLCTKNYIKTHNTDKSIDFKAYATEWTEPEYLLPPVNHLQNCNGNIYALKMSLYMYMVWKQCKGRYKPGKIILRWCPIERDEDGIPILYDGVPKILKEEDIELPYLKKEVIKMLQHDSKNI